MKKALISTIEDRTYLTGAKGYRIAQVEDETNIFPVAEGLYWADCDDTVIADEFYLDTTTNSSLPIPKNTFAQSGNNGPAVVGVTSI